MNATLHITWRCISKTHLPRQSHTKTVRALAWTRERGLCRTCLPRQLLDDSECLERQSQDSQDLRPTSGCSASGSEAPVSLIKKPQEAQELPSEQDALTTFADVDGQYLIGIKGSIGIGPDDWKWYVRHREHSYVLCYYPFITALISYVVGNIPDNSR